MNEQSSVQEQSSAQKLSIYGAFSRKEDSCSREEFDNLGNYVFAEQDTQDTVAVRNINENNVPSGEKTSISRDQFLNCYLPEPALYNNKVLPAIRELHETIEQGEKALENDELLSAEYEFKNALAIDEKNIRATFDLGLTYLEMQDWASTEQVFQKLIKMEAPFQREHKHLFNKFGIELRKKGMHKHALQYYAKAVRLERQDENLMFNIARVFYDKGQISKCKCYLQKALDHNPNLNAASYMLNSLKD